MSQGWKTIRVFISSTFRDMQAERDHLVRFVFPKLRQELLQRRIHLVDVDLRWGVTSEQDALSVCREVVDECRPRFLCMLGGRYGWVPPGKTRSITADEVHYGVLDRDLKSRGFAHFYFRDPSATVAMVEAASGEFREPADSRGAVALADLKTAIVEAGLQPFIYQAEWDDQSRRLIGLKEFGDRVYADLKQSIDQEFGPTTGEKPDEFTEENEAMEAFIEERVQRFVLGSRQPVWNELRQHAEGTAENGYLCLTGEAGSGKSALLGKFCQDYRAAHPQDLVIPHFVGAGPGSTDVRRTLRRLCHELATGAGLTAEIPEDPEKLRVAFAELLQQTSAQKRVVILLDAMNQFDSTTQLAGWSWLPEELPATARVILSTPVELQKEGQDVVGRVTPHGESTTATSGDVAYNNLRHRRIPPKEVALGPLTAGDAEAIIREFLHRYRKSMTDAQRAALLAKADAGTPLYLLVALEELRTLGTYEQITDRIAQLPPDTRAVFIWILKRLEEDGGFRDASGRKIGRELVSRFVSLIGASQHGLSQQELVELLSPGDPQGNVAALAQLLRPYLMQRGELLDFYHGQFREAVEATYLGIDDGKLKAHTELAEYFHAQDYWRESVEDRRERAKRLPPTPRPANVRKVTELPWQRLMEAQLSGQWEEVEKMFTNLCFLEAKVEAGVVFELAGDFAVAVNVMPRERPQRQILKLLDEAIHRDIHFIARHPTTLFQCMWNACWWYDCPQAAGHYDPPKDGWPQRGPPWVRSEPKLSALLESWQTAKVKATPHSVWVRSLRPPLVCLGSAQRSVFCGHEDDVTSVSFSPDGRRIASAGSNDGTVRVWDVDSGEEVACLPIRGERVISVCFSTDARRLAAGLGNKTVHVWDVDSGENVACLRGHENKVTSVSFSPKHRRIASGSEDKTVRVWDVDSGEEVACLRGHEEAVSNVCFSPDGRRLASASWDQTVRVWDVDSGQEVACLRGHRSIVRSVSFSPDGRRLASGSGGSEDTTVRVWDADSAEELACLRGHENWVSSVSFSPDGRRIASGSGDKTVRVWDADSSEELACLRGHESWVNSVSFSPDGRHIASGSGDKTVRIWDPNNGELLAHIHGHEDWVGSICFSPDGRRLASGSRDKTIVWDAITGEERACLRGRDDSVWSLCFSADGCRLASWGWGKTPRVWDAESGEELSCLSGHGVDVTCACFSADGHRLATGLTDATVRIWDADTGEELVCLHPYEGIPVWSVCFSLDGRRLTTKSGDDWDPIARTWDVQKRVHFEGIRREETAAATKGEAIWRPWRAFRKDSETIIESTATGETVGWYPLFPSSISSDPAGRTWAAAATNHLHLFTLQKVASEPA